MNKNIEMVFCPFSFKYPKKSSLNHVAQLLFIILEYTLLIIFKNLKIN